MCPAQPLAAWLRYARPSTNLWTARCGPCAIGPSSSGMSVVQHLYRLDGVATRATLVGLTSRAAVDRALRAGDILRDGHGRYAVPVAQDVAGSECSVDRSSGGQPDQGRSGGHAVEAVQMLYDAHAR